MRVIAYKTPREFGQSSPAEPRDIGAGHTIVFQFNVAVSSFGGATAMDTLGGSIGSAIATLSGNEAIVTLTGIPDNQRVVITLSGVTGPVDGTNSTASIGFLVGDVTNNRIASAGDISATKARLGQAVGSNNYRFDINRDGSISQQDVSMLKARAGMVLSP